jgi:hypothetical protein
MKGLPLPAPTEREPQIFPNDANYFRIDETKTYLNVGDMKVVEHPESYEVRDDHRSIKHFYFKGQPSTGRLTKRQAEQRAKALVASSVPSLSLPAARRFIRPWQVIERDNSFEVTDAAGLGLVVVHFDTEPSRQLMLKRLSKDEARRLARKVARLSALRPGGERADRGEA